MNGMAICLRPQTTRRAYLHRLVADLKYTVQLMPHHKSDKCRTRLDHCQNMARITERFVLTGQPDEKKSLSKSCMLHDIGHQRFGHDAEREINRLFPKSGHNNTRQSLRFCLDEEECISPLFSKSKYQETEFLVEKDRLDNSLPILDVLDRIENCFGDILDIYYGYSPKLASKLIKEIDSSIELSHFKPKDSFSLLEYIVNRRAKFTSMPASCTSYPELLNSDLYLDEVISTNKKIRSYIKNSSFFILNAYSAKNEIQSLCSYIYDHFSEHNLRDQDVIDIMTSSLVEIL